MRKIILIISLFFMIIFGIFGCSDINHVHSGNENYTSVFVQASSGKTLEDYSGTIINHFYDLSIEKYYKECLDIYKGERSQLLSPLFIIFFNKIFFII